MSPEATSSLVRVQRGPITTITLMNPPLNLVTAELTAQLRETLTRVADDEEVRAVVLSGGTSRAFCAGSDVKEFAGLRGRSAEGKLLVEKLVYRQLADLPMPTIAAIEGDALGGGLELALCCDLRVASSAARLGMPEVRLGVIPGSGGTQRLPRIVGPAHAKELILMGGIVDADEAWRIGLVNRVAEPGGAEALAREMASQIAQRGPLAVRLAKRLIDRALDGPLDAGLAAETDASQIAFDSDDLAEGAAAFAAKRPPTFTGR